MAPAEARRAEVGVVVIGRNEGDRLRRCLASLAGTPGSVVYVDSGSTDGSVAMAANMGAELVELDMTIPFTAARARNEGMARLLAVQPHVAYVQFVDGDCEVAAGWLEKAYAFLADHPDVAVVCGRRRERFPERSIYNRLCDLEWDTPVGEARACGGDALMRVAALGAVGGYRAGLIAGEEPELCVRLRAAGWKIWRLDVEMTLHDAAMTRFGQWWKRGVRSGHAFAEGAALHGTPPERHWVRETQRAWVWGLALPVFIVVSAIAFSTWLGLMLLAAYPVQIIRLYMKGTRKPGERFLQALFLVLGKFPEATGVMQFHLNRLRGISAKLIEYK